MVYKDSESPKLVGEILGFWIHGPFFQQIFTQPISKKGYGLFWVMGELFIFQAAHY